MTLQATGGHTIPLDLSAPPVARMGDDSYGIRMVSPGGISFDTVMIRRGGLVVSTLALSRAPGTLLAPFTRQAWARAESKLR